MNIFVAKLNPNTDDHDLEEAFSQFGDVKSAKVIMDRDTGSSKCYGFVEMYNDEEAQSAIEALDESDLDGNTIVVKEARPKENRGGGGRGGFNKGRRGPGGGGGRGNGPRRSY